MFTTLNNDPMVRRVAGRPVQFARHRAQWLTLGRSLRMHPGVPEDEARQHPHQDGTDDQGQGQPDQERDGRQVPGRQFRQGGQHEEGRRHDGGHAGGTAARRSRRPEGLSPSLAPPDSPPCQKECPAQRRTRFTVDESDRLHAEKLGRRLGPGELPERQGVNPRELAQPVLHVRPLTPGADGSQHVIRGGELETLACPPFDHPTGYRMGDNHGPAPVGSASGDLAVETRTPGASDVAGASTPCSGTGAHGEDIR